MADRKTIETYNSKAADYVDMVSEDKPDRGLRDFIDTVPKGGLVLDWGCGPGNSAAMMQAAGLVAEASDASAKMVYIARNTFDVNAKVETFNELDAIGRYDGIWANFSLLHAPKSDMAAHLSAAHKALKTGGHFHIGMKLGTGEQRDTLNRMYTYYEEAELKDIMTNAGFTILSTRTGEAAGMVGHLEPFVVITARA